jgi:proteasome accessory factor A
MPAVDLQRRYLETALRKLPHRSAQTDRVLAEWQRTLDDLEHDPLSTSDRLDWSAKRRLYQEWIDQEHTTWQDDALQSLDLEYHNIDPKASLHAGLEAAGAMVRLTDDARIEAAATNPPENTRAFGRGLIVSRLVGARGVRYVIDWDAAFIEHNRQLDMRNPFHTYEKEALRFTAGAA